MFIFDSHLDLGMNAVRLNRDLTRTVEELRSHEVGMPEPGRALGTVTFPAMRKGEVAPVEGNEAAGDHPRCHPSGG